MQTSKGSKFPAQGLADDIAELVKGLARVTDLAQPVEVHLESATTIRRVAGDIASEARGLAAAALKERADSVGKEDAAVEKARKPVERIPLDKAERSAVIGNLRDHKTGRAITAGHVVAKTPEGQVIGESKVDGLGSFAIELETTPDEVHIEAIDADGKPIGLSTVDLGGEGNAAHFTEIFGTGGSREAAKERPVDGDKEYVTTRPAKVGKSDQVRRIRRSVIEVEELGRSDRQK